MGYSDPLFAELYNHAFDWDLGEECAWLLDRMGQPQRVIEPFFGNGRYLPPMAMLGVSLHGIDSAAAMLEVAKQRAAAAGISDAGFTHADVCEFDLERYDFDGAFCPVNSFGYLLSPEAGAAHLACMAKHLKPGAVYMMQVDMLAAISSDRQDEPTEQTWDSEGTTLNVRAHWQRGDLDPESLLEKQSIAFEIIDGPRAGERTEYTEEMLRWTWRRWQELIEASPFTHRAAWDGLTKERGPVSEAQLLNGRFLCWHELVRG